MESLFIDGFLKSFVLDRVERLLNSSVRFSRSGRLHSRDLSRAWAEEHGHRSGILVGTLSVRAVHVCLYFSVSPRADHDRQQLVEDRD